MSNSKLFARAQAFAKAHPTRPPSRSSGTWDQLCGVLVYQFVGSLGGIKIDQIKSDAGVGWRKRPTGSIASAIIVARGSGKLQPHAARAPIGAFHYWDIGRHGHVGIDLNGGGSDVFMASTHVRWGWGSALGVQSVAGYSKATGARYLGWATNYTGGLPKLPSEIGPRDRVVAAADGVNARTAPSTSARIVTAANRPKGAAIEMNAYADDGETVAGSSRWYRGANGRWYWAGAFTSKAAGTLPKITTKQPAPAPAPEPTPPAPIKPAPAEPAPEPTPVTPPSPIEREHTMPTVPVPSTPDVILPANVRAGLYLGNWAAGVILAAAAAGVVAIDAPVHPALVAAIAVYGVLSSAISGLARANTQTVKK